MKYIYCLTIISFILSCKNQQREADLNEAKIYERTIKFYQQKNYPKAKDCFDTLISINPSNGEYYFKRGYSKSMILNDDNGAIVDFLNSIKYNYINKKSAYLNIGAIYKTNMKFDSAIFFYNKSLEIDSSFEKAKIGKS